MNIKHASFDTLSYRMRVARAGEVVDESVVSAHPEDTLALVLESGGTDLWNDRNVMVLEGSAAELEALLSRAIVMIKREARA